MLLADLSPTRGREQSGKRPVVVVSDRRYGIVPGLVLAVPLTSTNRNLRHHVEIAPGPETGLVRTSYAMTEQVRALAVDRIERQLGAVDETVATRISRYLHLFIA